MLPGLQLSLQLCCKCVVLRSTTPCRLVTKVDHDARYRLFKVLHGFGSQCVARRAMSGLGLIRAAVTLKAGNLKGLYFSSAAD